MPWQHYAALVLVEVSHYLRDKALTHQVAHRLSDAILPAGRLEDKSLVGHPEPNEYTVCIRLASALRTDCSDNAPLQDTLKNLILWLIANVPNDVVRRLNTPDLAALHGLIKYQHASPQRHKPDRPDVPPDIVPGGNEPEPDSPFMGVIKPPSPLTPEEQKHFATWKETFGDEITTDSVVMYRALKDLSAIAQADGTVLILGETGTGKDVVARAIHNQSKRKGCVFVPVNTGGLNRNLTESELFGHEKGAFTGAYAQHRGCFEQACGGTLFLDEIGDATMDVQVRLLRVFQEKKIKRLGGEEDVGVNVRVIIATNRILEQLIRNGTFRDDLYYRLSGCVIELPPLRERPGDIPLLVERFLRKMSEELSRNVNLDPKLIQVFQRCRWLGNVRELENTIESGARLAQKSGIITEQELGNTGLGRKLRALSPKERELLFGIDSRVQKALDSLASTRGSGMSKKKRMELAAQAAGIGISLLYELLGQAGYKVREL